VNGYPDAFGGDPRVTGLTWESGGAFGRAKGHHSKWGTSVCKDRIVSFSRDSAGLEYAIVMQEHPRLV
jgi:hypothetical protein